jgi:hypothetical protein
VPAPPKHSGEHACHTPSHRDGAIAHPLFPIHIYVHFCIVHLIVPGARPPNSTAVSTPATPHQTVTVPLLTPFPYSHLCTFLHRAFDCAWCPPLQSTPVSTPATPHHTVTVPLLAPFPFSHLCTFLHRAFDRAWCPPPQSTAVSPPQRDSPSATPSDLLARCPTTHTLIQTRS